MNVELIFHRLFVPIASVKARSVFCNNFEKNFSFFRRDKFFKQINFVIRYYFIYTSRGDFAPPPPLLIISFHTENILDLSKIESLILIHLYSLLRYIVLRWNIDQIKKKNFHSIRTNAGTPINWRILEIISSKNSRYGKILVHRLTKPWR